MKQCSKCKQQKDETEFYKNKARNDGLNGKCKDCDKAYVLQWAKDNKERINARNRAWAKANPIKNSVRVKRWQKVNPEKTRSISKAWRTNNKEAAKQSMANWQKKNKSVMLFHLSKRRTSKLNACPKWLSAIDKAQIQECYDISQAKFMQNGIIHNVDHIIPLQGENVCGLHVPWNLQVIPASHNFSKGNRMEARSS